MNVDTPPAHPTLDTSTEADEVQLACFRRMSPLERLQAGCRMSQRGRRLAVEAIRRLHPGADADEIRLRSIAQAYGARLADDVSAWLRMRRG